MNAAVPTGPTDPDSPTAPAPADPGPGPAAGAGPTESGAGSPADSQADNQADNQADSQSDDRTDAGPPADQAAPPRSRWSGSGAHLLIAALCALLGFAVVLQVQRTAAGDTLAAARPDDLVQILDELQRREADLNAEIAGLQDSLGRLQRSGESSAEALAEARRQSAALGILTGTVPATGPGVTIVIADPDGKVPPEVLLDAIQELRNAGAEAFQVGPVRIGVDSAFTGSGGAITLDGQRLSAPYTITAVGDPPTLAAALAIPGGVLDTVRRAGGTMEVTQSDSVTVDALRQPREPLYARPAS
ncbi:DUF881 domain-containing protein [Nakamurella sp.]|uniref:DUF881 domain-containing protein n=1 Tax=Nakamurella sp. TaxID=1869182 RepID=UPI003B3BDC05